MALLDYALCTVEDVEAQYNNGDSYNTNDITVVENMINLATQYAETYIGRHIKVRSTDTTETFDVEPRTQDIFLTNFPIISVTSITEDGDALTEGEDEEYLEYANTGKLYRNDAYWTKGRKKLVAVYKGGYATVPDNLFQWCVEVVGFMFETKEDGNVKSERVGQLSVTYASAGQNSVGNIIAQKPYLKEVLDGYKSNFL